MNRVNSRIIVKAAQLYMKENNYDVKSASNLVELTQIMKVFVFCINTYLEHDTDVLIQNLGTFKVVKKEAITNRFTGEKMNTKKIKFTYKRNIKINKS